MDIVTGAFGYTGRYIARLLLDQGRTVKTITGHPERPNPFGERVKAEPFNFENPSALIESLRGADTLYNTYWIRFPHGTMTYERALMNSRTLISAAKDAGIRRLVHISITNASETSPFPYFRGKGLVEQAIRDCSLSYAILRPTVIFGPEGLLINNIAWLLRRMPIFAIPGSGDYKLQPIFVEDLAELAVEAASSEENVTFDAAGPETFTFEELVRLIARTVGSRARITHVSPSKALFFSRLAGRLLNDVVLTRDEIDGLMANLLVSDSSPRGRTRLSEWLSEHAQAIGTNYFSELARHYG